MSEVRPHITDHINAARLALEARRASVSLIVYVVAFAVFVVFGMGYVLGKLPGGTTGDARELRFAVSDGAGITPGRSELRFKGVPAGVLTDVKTRGRTAIVTMKLREEFGPVYNDARAVLRPNTALEDMYLDIIDRGSVAAGEAKSDRPLRADQTRASVQVEDVLDAFQPDVRRHLATILSDLGGGLEGRGDELQEAFVRAVPLLQVAGRLTGELDKRSTSTRRLVHQTRLLSEELARREAQLRQVVGNGADLMETLGKTSGPLRMTISELGPTMQELAASMTSVTTVLPDVDRAVSDLRPVATEVPAALTAIRALSRDADPALDRLRPPGRRLVPFADAVAPLSRELSAAVVALRPQAKAIDHVTKSAAGCGDAIQRFFQWTPSVFKFGDSRAHAARGDFALSLDTTSVGKDPNVFAGKSCAPGAPSRATP